MTNEHQGIAKIPEGETFGFLVVSIQLELSEETLARFQLDLLEQIRKLQPKGVILNESGLPLFDRHEFLAMRRSLEMARLMGRQSVFAGIHPGFAAAMAELDIDCDNLLTARSLEDAFELLGNTRSTSPQSDKS